MEQNDNKKNSVLTVVDIAKLFRGKLKLLICLALAAFILGGALGVGMSFLDRSYTTDITFYLEPGDKSQALLPLLQSESFAEKLLLEENGLPKKEDCNAQDYANALAAIEEYNAAREQRKQLRRELDLIPYSVTPIETKYNSLKTSYTEIYELLNTYKLAPSDEVAKDETHAEKIAEYEAALAIAKAELDAYKAEVYDPAIANKYATEEEYAKTKRLLIDARDKAEEACEKVLSVWREDIEVQRLVAIITESISFKYTKIVDSSDVKDTVENQNCSFLVISVDIDDPELANTLIDKIKSVTPYFAETNVERLSDISEAKCSLISPFASINDYHISHIVKDAAKYAIISAVAAVAVACIVIVVVGILPEELRSEKKQKSAHN